MMRILLSLMLAAAVAAGASAQTAEPAPPPGPSATSPYSATVPVAGTSDAQRDAAMSTALEQVLQQVSPGFSASPDVLAQASGYVRDYRYRRAAGGGLELQVAFDPGAIGRLAAQEARTAALAGQPGTAATAGGVAIAGPGAGTLWVDGIDNSHAFAALLSVLRGDPALRNVIPVAAEGDGVLLQVTSNRSLDTVLPALTGPGGHLVPETQPHPGADASLRWTP